MRKHLIATTLAGLTALSTFGFAIANAQPPSSKSSGECFFTEDWDGWKATPDSKTIYIRVGLNKIWRLDLSSACPALQAPIPHLITKVHGSPEICSALDLDLRVSDDSGFSTPCIVGNLTRLSAEEAAALPKSLKP